MLCRLLPAIVSAKNNSNWPKRWINSKCFLHDRVPAKHQIIQADLHMQRLFCVTTSLRKKRHRTDANRMEIDVWPIINPIQSNAAEIQHPGQPHSSKRSIDNNNMRPRKIDMCLWAPNYWELWARTQARTQRKGTRAKWRKASLALEHREPPCITQSGRRQPSSLLCLLIVTYAFSDELWEASQTLRRKGQEL